MITLTIILGLASYRLTRLWRDDTITEGMRDWVDDKLTSGRGDRIRLEGPRLWLAELLDCPYCLSVWLAGGSVLLVDSATSRSVELPVAVWGSSAAVAIATYWLVDLAFEASSLVTKMKEDRGG